MIKHQRLSLQDAAARLSFRDKRAADTWCRANGVHVHIDKKNRYIYETELDLALELDFLKGLQLSYPDNYEEVYAAILENDVLEIHRLKNLEADSNKKLKRKNYYPEGEFSKMFSNKN